MTAVNVGESARRSTLLANSAVLSSAMVAVSAANYLLNVVLARLLDPTEFGDVSLLVNLVLMGSLVAATVQMVASKAVAAAPARRAAVQVALGRAALVAGGAVFAVLGGGAWVWAGALHASTPWMFVILALGLPVYFNQAVHRGLLQGELRFGRLALSYGVEAFVRVAVTLGLVLAGFGVIGAAVGISVSFIASGLVARVGRLPSAERGGGLAGLGMRSAVVGAIALLVGQTVVNTADLVLAKATFDPVTAGIYASAALVGRAIFFVAASVTASVFPLVARAEISAVELRRTVRRAVGLVALVGLVGTVGIALFGGGVVVVAFGPGYADAQPLLVPYALATSLFAVASLLAAVEVAAGRVGAAFALVAASLAQTAVLAIWGSSPSHLAWLQVATMAGAVVAVAVVRSQGFHSDIKRYKV
jgi:O-antigen/teichoic acid export membrane protein